MNQVAILGSIQLKNSEDPNMIPTLSQSELASVPGVEDNQAVAPPSLESGTLRLRQLYESDETGWLDETARLIDSHQYEQLDYESLKEYIQDMAIRDRREARSHLRQLLTHLLKWEYQPRKRSRSWESTIVSQRDDLEDILSSKTLRRHIQQELDGVYNRAVKLAMKETGLERKDFPPTCPYSLDFILSEELPSKKKS